MTDLLQSFLNSLQWINTADDEKLEIFKECSQRFATATLSDNKIASVAEKHLEIPETSLRNSLISVVRLALNRLHLKNKGPSTIENAVLCSRIMEEKRQFLIDLVHELAALPDCATLLQNVQERDTKGTYRGSNWRMDIDIGQRSLKHADPAVNFVCELETAGGRQTLTLTPAMLIKLEAELQKAVNAVQKAKTTRV